MINVEIAAQVPILIDTLVPPIVEDLVPGIVDPIIDAEIAVQVPALINDAITDGEQVGLEVRYNQAQNELDILEYIVTTTAVDKTLIVNEYCTVTVLNARTITLPANPTVGDRVAVGVLNTELITIGRNGQSINGVAENMLIDYEYVDIQFIYIGGSIGWRIR